MKRPVAFSPRARGGLFSFRRSPLLFPGVRLSSRFLTAIVPCLAGAGIVYQAVATSLDRHAYPPPGQLVPIDGRRLHVQAAGSGAPAVVLESGLGGMSSAWGWIQPEAARFTRVVSYDRPGLGWSDAVDPPVTAVHAARRLRGLLRATGVEAPYVLVGHSMGGLLVRVFADHFPEEVAGMVLIDAAHPDQHRRSAAIERHMSSGFRLLRCIPLLARLGYVRLTGFFDAWPQGLPPRQAAEAKAFLSSHGHLKTTLDESLAWEGLCAEVRRTGRLGDRPLAVVSAGKDALPGSHELQGELAALSSNSRRLAVEGADHVTLVTHREHALSVVEAIRQVVEDASRPRSPSSIS
jgi:pimeloyl-ACP methyl ester carboxylesterase